MADLLRGPILKPGVLARGIVPEFDVPHNDKHSPAPFCPSNCLELRSVATVALPGVHLTGTGRGRSGWAWTPGLPQYRELTAAACCQVVLAVAHLLSSRRRSCFLATPIVPGLWPPGRERTP
jgi:hypothetical protein